MRMGPAVSMSAMVAPFQRRFLVPKTPIRPADELAPDLGPRRAGHALRHGGQRVGDLAPRFGGPAPAPSGCGRPAPLRGASLQPLVGGLPVHRLVVLALHERRPHHPLALVGRERNEARPGRQHEGPIHRGRRALRVEQGDERLPHLQLGDGGGGIHLRILAEGLGCGPDRLLVPRREGPERVLHPVPELAEDRLGDVEGVLGDEVDAHPLRADQPHHLLHLLEERSGRVAEEQVRLVEEEDQPGLVGVSHLGQVLVELGEQPEQEGASRGGATGAACRPPGRSRSPPAARPPRAGRRGRPPAPRRIDHRPAARAPGVAAGWRRRWRGRRCRGSSAAPRPARRRARGARAGP